MRGHESQFSVVSGPDLVAPASCRQSREASRPRWRAHARIAVVPPLQGLRLFSVGLPTTYVVGFPLPPLRGLSVARSAWQVSCRLL